jgi:hypothetical protein
MIEKILIAIVAAGCTAFVGWLFTDRARWQGSCVEARYALDAANDRAIEAERDAQKAMDELGYLKGYVVTLLNKPVVAILSDQQLQALTQNVVGYLSAMQSAPGQMS